MSAAGPQEVAETLHEEEGVPLWRQPEWRERFPWLVQGTTGRGTAEEPFDLGLFGESEVGATLGRWRRLRGVAGMDAALHARQVHGADVHWHGSGLPPGLLVMDGVDGHATDRPGLLLSVSVADCVPVFLVDASTQAVALVHAGWRGVAAGILERGLALLSSAVGTRPADVWLHCGPAICGRCYEVGPEVHQGVNPESPPPAEPTPIDLRAALVGRAAARGVSKAQCTVSAHCTRCGPGAFFSHRGGSPARQMGVLGLRA